MILRLYNTLTRKTEDFTPLEPRTVRMYVCGPTVYDDPHIGHARSAYIFDILHRYLEYKGFNVHFIRNVTDVDDKIIQKANETKQSCEQVAERYLKSYHEALSRLGIGRPTEEPKATEHIDAMLNLVSELVVKGAAYEAGGDVYFAVRKFPGYGKLSNRTLDELQAGARVEPGEHPGPTPGAGKQDPLDFALWKTAKPGEPSWDSPWGKGRPGWHIECSAMSTKYLGDTFDIHGGGVDLVFPHHENEIAQAQAIGKPFARYWIHNGLLTVNGEKMSKSLGNFITVERALEECGRNSNILKIFFVGAHYRSPIDYSKDNLKAAAGRWNRWYYFLVPAERERQRSSASAPDILPQELSDLEREFEQAMDDDLNTPEALAALDRVVNYGYRCWQELVSAQVTDREAFSLASGKVVAVADAFHRLRQVLGLTWRSLPPIDEEDRKLFILYEGARRDKNFTWSDVLRKQLEERELVVQDTPIGSILIPKQGDL